MTSIEESQSSPAPSSTSTSPGYGDLGEVRVAATFMWVLYIGVSIVCINMDRHDEYPPPFDKR